MSSLVVNKFQFEQQEFTKKKTFEFARDNGFTGKDRDKKVIEKTGKEGQWTKADVKKCPVVKSRSKPKNTSSFANKIAKTYFEDKDYKLEDYTGKKNDKGLIRKSDIVEWEKESTSGKVNLFTSGAQHLIDGFDGNRKLLGKVLKEFFGDKNYTSKSRWGKKQVQKSIEYLEIYNKINELN